MPPVSHSNPDFLVYLVGSFAQLGVHLGCSSGEFWCCNIFLNTLQSLMNNVQGGLVDFSCLNYSSTEWSLELFNGGVQCQCYLLYYLLHFVDFCTHNKVLSYTSL